MNKLLALFQVGHAQPGSPDSIVSLGWPQFAIVMAIVMAIVLAIVLLAAFAGLPW